MAKKKPARPARVISGGQTGADRGGLDAAIELGIPHGGWCPRGRRAEDGRIPPKYRLKETPTSRYPERTERNVLAADGTVVFTFGPAERGSALTLALAAKHGKPALHVDLDVLGEAEAVDRLRAWLAGTGTAILNVAGSREGGAPGLRERVWRIVKAAFAPS
ncbi:MAG TPA: putative molybdenum carrier protein [Planctomycetota bacterium]